MGTMLLAWARLSSCTSSHCRLHDLQIHLGCRGDSDSDEEEVHVGGTTTSTSEGTSLSLDQEVRGPHGHRPASKLKIGGCILS